MKPLEEFHPSLTPDDFIHVKDNPKCTLRTCRVKTVSINSPACYNYSRLVLFKLKPDDFIQLRDTPRCILKCHRVNYWSIIKYWMLTHCANTARVLFLFTCCVSNWRWSVAMVSCLMLHDIAWCLIDDNSCRVVACVAEDVEDLASQTKIIYGIQASGSTMTFFTVCLCF